MSRDAYIVRRNSTESRLLSRLGFDRDTLPVAEWRGRRLSRGGYGKAAVAWRITGESAVRKLCAGIVRILGARPQGQQTPEEQKALDRAQRTLAAFEDRTWRAESTAGAKENRSPALHDLLRRTCPSASESNLATIMSLVEQSAPKSVDDFMSRANDALAGRLDAWGRARAEFVNTMSRMLRAP